MGERNNRRMGDVLVELGLIDEHRLRHALEVSQQHNLKLGETLIHLAYLREDQVLGILKNLINVPTLDMEEGVIRKDAQVLLPQDRMHEMLVVPLAVKERLATVAFADPLNYVSVENVKFLINREVSPVLASQVQIRDILKALERSGCGREDLVLKDVPRSTPSITVQDMSPDNILRLLEQPEYSDLHITIGIPPALRRGRTLVRSNMPMVTPELMDSLIREILPQEQQAELRENKEVEYTYNRAGTGRYRMNVYMHRGGEIAVAARKIVEDIPSSAALGLPEGLLALLERKGVLLVSSPGGHGKDATLAALVDHINASRTCNIITFEDPIEYLHYHKRSNVNQREIGRDTSKDSAQLFEHVFRHDPDVLVLSNLKNRSMVEASIIAAQKGILVIAGITATDVFSALEQYLSTLSDDYLKAMFARSLVGVFSQRMVGARTDERQILIWEMLIGTKRVQTYIRDGKIYYIKGQATSLQGEYFPLEESLAFAVRAGKIPRASLEDEPFFNKDLFGALLER